MRIMKRKGAKGSEPAPVRNWPLSLPLLRLTEDKNDCVSIGDSFEHFFIAGGTGSGKTSGSATTLARAFLLAGYGGLVLCAKTGESQRWLALARECGREDSIIRFDASGRWRYNFLEQLMRTPPHLGGGLTDNAVHALMHVLQAGQTSGAGQDGQNDFWQKAVRELLSNAIAALYHAYGEVRIDELLALVNSAPHTKEQADDADFKTWSFCFSTMRRLFEAPKVKLPDREARQIVTYFGQIFGARLDAKTRSNILITLSAELSPFLKGPLHTLFCTTTNITPEATHEGVVLLVDLPVKQYEQVGVTAQMLMKYLWQKATERAR